MSAAPAPLDDLALEAFIHTFPLYEMARMRAATSRPRVAPFGDAGDTPDSPLRWCNCFVHSRKLLGAGGSRVVTPNNDTLYSTAWLDLDASPLVIDTPDTADRYHVLGLLDFYTNPFAHIGTRLTGNRAGSFLLSGPRWRGQVPVEFSAPQAHVRSPTRWVWVIGRFLVDGEQDLPAVHALQDGLQLRTLAAWQAGGPATAKRFEPGFDFTAPITAAHFASQVNRALRENPPPAAEADAMRRFAAVGIGPEAAAELQPAQAERLGQAIEAGLRQLHAAGLGGIERAGWCMPAPIVGGVDGGFGGDPLRRATVALKYIGALESREATYPMAYSDAAGQALSGRQAYRLRFAPGQLPPVQAFWSLTMYDTRDFMLVPNAIHRFAIGDRTPGLQKDADGGLTLCIQHAMPQQAAARANWLPAPRDGFYLCLRAYLPREEMLDGRCALPGLQPCPPA